MKEVVFPISPVPKPRMVRSDKWRRRKAVTDYFSYKDHLNLLADVKRFRLPNQYAVDFHIPMPPSWSRKKRERMDGQPHQCRPDWDNLCKGLQDSLMDEDSQVWDVHARKFWAREACIVIRIPEKEVSTHE